jgi:hypothetical protein
MVSLAPISNRAAIAILLTAAAALPLSAPSLAAARAAAPPAATQPPAAQPPAPNPAIDEEASRLREAMRQEVPGLISDTPQSEQAWAELTQSALAAASYRVERAQLLVVVDRNPRVQQMRILLARPDGPWQSLGGTKVSTGRAGGFEHFLTPTGVFRHTSAILDWRAEGTFNEHNVRGLGLQGMRVWDFGWQQALRGWGPPGRYSKMRFLLHATDPATLERRLGRPASDGCVRLPTEMDRFLDLHGLLDHDYELVAQRNRRVAELLLPDRTPTPLAGDALVVIDSSRNTNAIAATSTPSERISGSSRQTATVATHAKGHHRRLIRSPRRHGRAAIAAR